MASHLMLMEICTVFTQNLLCGITDPLLSSGKRPSRLGRSADETFSSPPTLSVSVCSSRHRCTIYQPAPDLPALVSFTVFQIIYISTFEEAFRGLFLRSSDIPVLRKKAHCGSACTNPVWVSLFASLLGSLGFSFC